MALVKKMGSRQLHPDVEMPDKIDFRDWSQIRHWIIELVQ